MLFKAILNHSEGRHHRRRHRHYHHHDDSELLVKLYSLLRGLLTHKTNGSPFRVRPYSSLSTASSYVFIVSSADFLLSHSRTQKLPGSSSS